MYGMHIQLSYFLVGYIVNTCQYILLLEEILHHLGCINLVHVISYQPQLVNAGFQPSTVVHSTNHKTRWWQLKYFLFSPLPGEMIQFDSYFLDGLVQPPTRKRLLFLSKSWIQWNPWIPWVRWGPFSSPKGLQIFRWFSAGSTWPDLPPTNGLIKGLLRITGWWFQIFFIFTSICGRFPFWLIFFKGVETTN